MAALLAAPTKNAVQKTLGAELLSSATTGGSITLSDTDGIPNLPGVLVVDRVDSNGTSTPSKREYIEYSGTSGSNVVITTRNVDGGGTTQTHAVGAVVEFVPDIVWADRIYDALGNIIDVATLAVDTTKIVTPTGTQTLTNKTLTSPVVNTPTMTSPSVTSGDLNLATGLNVQVNSADPWRTIWLGAGTLKPTTTSGCAAVATVEAGTNDIDYDVLAFDASTDENAFANFQMPESYDGGVVQFRYVWTNAAGLTTETVTFELSGRAYADSDAIDQAVGTPIEVADTWLAQNDIHISAWSGDVTIAGSPAGSQWVHFEVMRDVSEDNLTGDARLIGIQIRYKQAQFTD